MLKLKIIALINNKNNNNKFSHIISKNMWDKNNTKLTIYIMGINIKTIKENKQIKINIKIKNIFDKYDSHFQNF